VGNARTEVAEHGWEIYRTSSPRPTLIQVNAVLSSEGLEEVSDRMLRHYRKLDRFGVVDYIPINELDIRFKHRHDGAPGAS
jgi:hypothetical protein